jgi:hypothetical protein
MILYKDAYSGYEIVLLEHRGSLLGVTYDPKQARDPVPWHSDCHHCTSGLQHDLSIHVKRALQMVRTRRSNGQRCSYVIPTNTRPHFVVYWVDQNGVRHANVKCDDSKVLEISAEPLGEMVYQGNRREFQAPILHRSLKLLFTSRDASVPDVLAATRPLLARQLACGLPRGRQSTCNLIDWKQITKELTETSN